MSDLTQEIAPKSNSDSTDGCVTSKVDKEEIPATNGHDKEEISATNEHDKEEIPATNGHDKELKTKDQNGNNESAEEEDEEDEFNIKVNLPLIDTNTLEDEEDVIVELRSRMYRYDTSEDEPEFKERGTGNVKILLHKETKLYRILMRREITLKVCANHYITTSMQLKKHNNSEKVFVYSTLADLYENEVSAETFAIRFSSPENATIFKNAFDDAVEYLKQQEKKSKIEKEADDIASDLKKVVLDNEESAEKTNDEEESSH